MVFSFGMFNVSNLMLTLMSAADSLKFCKARNLGKIVSDIFGKVRLNFFSHISRRGGSPSKIPIAGSYLGVRGSSEDLLAGGRRLERQVGVTITRLGVEWS